MEIPGSNMWMIRAGQDGHVLPYFLDQRIAYLGWDDTGIIYPETTREDLRDRVARANPMITFSAVGNATRCIWEFCREVQIGDAVVTYDPRQRLYHIGIVRSDAEYGTVVWHYADTGQPFEDWGYVRQVDWVTTFLRDALLQTARNSLGRPPTHFLLPAEVSKEIRRLCG